MRNGGRASVREDWLGWEQISNSLWSGLIQTVNKIIQSLSKEFPPSKIESDIEWVIKFPDNVCHFYKVFESVNMSVIGCRMKELSVVLVRCGRREGGYIWVFINLSLTSVKIKEGVFLYFSLSILLDDLHSYYYYYGGSIFSVMRHTNYHIVHYDSIFDFTKYFSLVWALFH